MSSVFKVDSESVFNEDNFGSTYFYIVSNLVNEAESGEDNMLSSDNINYFLLSFPMIFKGDVENRFKLQCNFALAAKTLFSLLFGKVELSQLRTLVSEAILKGKFTDFYVNFGNHLEVAQAYLRVFYNIVPSNPFPNFSNLEDVNRVFGNFPERFDDEIRRHSDDPVDWDMVANIFIDFSIKLNRPVPLREFIYNRPLPTMHEFFELVRRNEYSRHVFQIAKGVDLFNKQEPVVLNNFFLEFPKMFCHNLNLYPGETIDFILVARIFVEIFGGFAGFSKLDKLVNDKRLYQEGELYKSVIYVLDTLKYSEIFSEILKGNELTVGGLTSFFECLASKFVKSSELILRLKQIDWVSAAKCVSELLLDEFESTELFSSIQQVEIKDNNLFMKTLFDLLQEKSKADIIAMESEYSGVINKFLSDSNVYIENFDLADFLFFLPVLISNRAKPISIVMGDIAMAAELFVVKLGKHFKLETLKNVIKECANPKYPIYKLMLGKIESMMNNTPSIFTELVPFPKETSNSDAEISFSLETGK